MHAQVEGVRSGHADDGGEFGIDHLEDFRVVGRVSQLDGVQHRVAAEPFQVMPVLHGAVVAEKMHFIELLLIEQAFQRPRLVRHGLRRIQPLQHFILLAGRQ